MTPLTSLKSREGFADLRRLFAAQFYALPVATDQIGKLSEAQSGQRKVGTLHLPGKVKMHMAKAPY